MKWLDLTILKFKNPTGFPKFEQKPFSENQNFQANECRHLVYYSLIFLLKPWLTGEKQKYFDHLLKFILFIRLMSQKSISRQDIALSSLLIEEYLSVFENYYGEENLSFNLHCHQHYPMQVLRTGGINRNIAFGFEGFFFISKDLHYGTRNLFGQTANNIVLKQRIYFENDDYEEENEKDLIIEPETTSIAKLLSFSKDFFISLGFEAEKTIETSSKARLKKHRKYFKILIK